VRLLEKLDEPYRTMVSISAATTGLRVGELLALRWRAVCFDHGTLAVRESVYEGRFRPPRTQRARRTIPIGPNGLAALSAHRERAFRRNADDLVFGNRNGDPFTGVEVAAKCVATGGRSCGSWTRAVASVPPHPLVAAQRSEGAREDRPGATRTCECDDDAEHLYALVDASHRRAIEAVEQALFENGPKSAAELDRVKPVSDSVN
jgi:hypothetical protein